MYLKKIKLHGFKSFADSTLLEFHPGITAIVGPNGCGKSNISDAFRWVLGEQSAKSLRGGKMHDIIFAGTTKRKSLNFAEVAMTLGDVQGALKTEYDEVTVSRQIHRSGESHYAINRHPVRFKDVNDLFLDSGMGKDAYSIFEQGKLDQVITLSPLERRAIFEEAAGILRFLQRKKEALSRLQQTEQNMERILDIYQEVVKHVQVLEKQAEKARLYQEDKQALQALEMALIAARWLNFQKKEERLAAKEEAKKDEIREGLKELNKGEIQCQEAMIRFNHAARELQRHKEEAIYTRSQKEMGMKAKKNYEERLKEIVVKEKEWKQELLQLESKRKQLEGEKEHAAARQKEIEKQFLVLEEERKKEREQLNFLEKETASFNENRQKEQNMLMEFLQKENRLESELKQHLLRLEHAEGRISSLDKELKNSQNALEEVEKSIQEKTEELNNIRVTIQSHKEALSLLSQQVEEKGKEIDAIKEYMDRIFREKAELKGRLNVLLRLREELEGFSNASKRLLKESTHPKSPLHQKIRGLYEIFLVDEEQKGFFSALMKPYSQTLVVATFADLCEVVSFVKKEQLGDCSFFCLESLLEKEVAGHFFRRIKKEKNLEGALFHSEFAVWVEDVGGYIDQNKVLFFPSDKKQNIFLREAELKNLQKQQTLFEEELREREETLKRLQQEWRIGQEKKGERDRLLKLEETKHIEKKYALERCERDRQQYKLRWDRGVEERAAVEKSCVVLKQAVAEGNAHHAAEKMQLIEAQKRLREWDSMLQEKQKILKEQIQRMELKEVCYQKSVEEKRKVEHQLHVVEVKELELQQQEKRLHKEIVSLEEKRVSMDRYEGDSEAHLNQLEITLKTILEQCAAWEEKKAVFQKEQEQIESLFHLQKNKIVSLEKEQHDLAIQKAQTAVSLQTLEQECRERFQMAVAEVCKVVVTPVDETIEKMEKKIPLLRKKIEEAGAINLASIEELEVYQERDLFLKRQLEDLATSKKELVEIITQLDEESRKIFKETFEQVHRNFKKNFEILFQGGEAALQFTQAADVLESGIEIVAKPPGKQMRSIHLMSGGEKCLTALALLFAIFEVKPAPFCILDEIDAPLDDANVERFLNVVRQFSDRCQFIIITHNKRTMAIADRLFGVSMQEKGVSKILAIEFENFPSENALV